VKIPKHVMAALRELPYPPGDPALRPDGELSWDWAEPGYRLYGVWYVRHEKERLADLAESQKLNDADYITTAPHYRGRN
jgi:hypothetical protein